MAVVWKIILLSFIYFHPALLEKGDAIDPTIPSSNSSQSSTVPDLEESQLNNTLATAQHMTTSVNNHLPEEKSNASITATTENVETTMGLNTLGLSTSPASVTGKESSTVTHTHQSSASVFSITKESTPTATVENTTEYITHSIESDTFSTAITAQSTANYVSTDSMSFTQTSEMTSSSSLENETVTMTSSSSSSSTTSSQSLENDTRIATSHSPENVTITAFDSQTSQSGPTTRPEVTTVSSSASTSFGLTTSNSTNSSIEGLIPRMIPRNIPKTTQKPPSLTTSTRANPRASTLTHSILPCNPQTPKRDGLVSQCLIAIAVLAGVATIFMVCTIVLCTKLSSNKQRYRVKEANGTELVCISALLPDGSNSYRGRPKTQKSNGALFPTTDDSEGDDLTLHSFLPDHS